MDKRTKYVYDFGPFRLDTEERLLLCDGEPVYLKPKLFDMLSTLVQNSGHLLTKTDLMNLIWPNSFVAEHNLTVCIFELRKALREDRNHSYIQTVSRSGYRFVSDVRKVKDESGELNVEEYTRSALNLKETSETMTRIASIGILPFNSLGKEVDDTYLGIGLTDALITKLSNLRQVIVRPTSSTRSISGRPRA
jgi:DNA-binding winged helix-turn-helix (wHTH) protein